MKRRGFLAALTAGVVLSLAAPAGAAENGGADSDRTDLTAKLREHFDDSSAPVWDDAGSRPRSKAICRGAGVDDRAGDSQALDVSAFDIAYDCGSSTWAVVWQTFSPWSLNELALQSIFLDTDGNLANGCDGYDFLVGGDAQSGGVFRIPSCEADWPLVADAGFAHDDGTSDALLVWEGAAIGNPAGAVATYLAVENIHSAQPDEVPDAGDVVVGSASGSHSNGRCDIPNDETATNNSVARLYKAYFKRDADSGGLGYWVPKYRSGELCLTEISEYFAQSQEFVSTYGNLGIPEFVRLVYVNVLGREPDPDGYNYWADQLANRGVPRGTMMVGFSESPEFRSLTGLP